MLGNHPGPWQFFVKRIDNLKLPILEVKRKYLTEQNYFEEQQYRFFQQNNWLRNQPAGDMDPYLSTPQIEMLTPDGKAMITPDGLFLISLNT